MSTVGKRKSMFANLESRGMSKGNDNPERLFSNAHLPLVAKQRISSGSVLDGHFSLSEILRSLRSLRDDRRRRLELRSDSVPVTVSPQLTYVSKPAYVLH